MIAAGPPPSMQQQIQSAPSAPVKKDRGLLDWLSVATSVGGGALGGALGPVGVIGGSAAGGALGELLEQLIAKDEIDVGDIGREAAFGGIGGGVGLGVGKVLGGIGGKLARGTRKAIINPKVAPSPFAAAKEARIASTVSKYAKGSASKIRGKSPEIVRGLGKDIQQSFKGYNPKVKPKLAKSTLTNYLDDVATYDASDAVFKKAALTQISKVGKLKRASDVYSYKSKLSGQLSNVFNKLDKGTTLTQREEALHATWRSLDDILTNTAPNIKNLTSAQSAFYQAAPGLQQSAGRNFNVPFSNIPIPGSGQLLQSAGSGMAGLLERGGSSQTLQQILGQTGTRAFAPQPSQPSLFSRLKAWFARKWVKLCVFYRVFGVFKVLCYNSPRRTKSAFCTFRQ